MSKTHYLNLSSADFEQLVTSLDWRHRAEVARRTTQQQYLDILVHDPAWQVRLAVAFSGKDKYLKMLEADENEVVRQEVERQWKFKKEVQKW